MPDDKPKFKEFACGAVIPDCDFITSAATEEELLRQVAVHAAHEHGVTEITPELVEKVKGAIRTR